MDEESIAKVLEHRWEYPHVNISGFQYYSGTQKKKLKKMEQELEYLDQMMEEMETRYGYRAEELEYGPGDVYKRQEQEIRGFVGLDDTYIAGIFVRSKDQSLGIGTQLLDFVKKRKEELSLRVYQKNENAIRFYQREAFQAQEEGIDEDTKEKEYLMIWKKQNG